MSMHLIQRRFLVQIRKHHFASRFEPIFVLVVGENIASAHENHGQNIDQLLALLRVDESARLDLVAVDAASAEFPDQSEVDTVYFLQHFYPVFCVQKEKLVFVNKLQELCDGLLLILSVKHRLA